MKNKLKNALVACSASIATMVAKKKNKKSLPTQQSAYLEKLPGGVIIDKRLYAELSKSNPDHLMIHWNNLKGSTGFVFVVGEDKQEKLFAAGQSGSSEVSWIQHGKSYEFNLYEDEGREKPLVRLSLVRSSSDLKQSAFNIR